MNRRLVGFFLIASTSIGAAVFAKYRLDAYEPPEYVGPILPKAEHVAKPGDLVVPFVLAGVDGSAKRIGGQTARPTLIHFWASWCSPCMAELPAIQSAFERSRNSNFDLVSIALDDRRHVSEIIPRYGLTFPILLSEGARFDPLAALGSAQGAVPFDVVLDRRGVVMKQRLGGFAAGATELLSWAEKSAE